MRISKLIFSRPTSSAGNAELSAQKLVQASSAAPRGAPTRGPNNYDAIYHRVEAARTAKLDALAPVSDAMLQEPADGDWLDLAALLCQHRLQSAGADFGCQCGATSKRLELDPAGKP